MVFLNVETIVMWGLMLEMWVVGWVDPGKMSITMKSGKGDEVFIYADKKYFGQHSTIV